ncbi:MAG: class I SAM-dependent methyltransferase [Methanoregulaceae archaeon]|nr:class I SAM-dependent methyltransferase [Methanoregulaceae archaeon]
MEHIRNAFNAFADQYDSQRRWVIPEMDTFYSTAVWMADYPGTSPAILDIGAGTGLLSAMLLGRYPDASVTLLDISEQMLAVARKRFEGRKNIRYITGDYSGTDLGGKYDLVCSALSIHHLPDKEKHRLYCRICDVLNPGGIFVNADQASGETPAMDRKFLEYWNEFFSDGPLSPEERAEIMKRRDTLDQNAKLSDQLCWLKDCGFHDVDVVYRNRIFVVLTGRKAP